MMSHASGSYMLMKRQRLAKASANFAELRKVTLMVLIAVNGSGCKKVKSESDNCKGQRNRVMKAQESYVGFARKHSHIKAKRSLLGNWYCRRSAMEILFVPMPFLQSCLFFYGGVVIVYHN